MKQMNCLCLAFCRDFGDKLGFLKAVLYLCFILSKKRTNEFVLIFQFLT